MNPEFSRVKESLELDGSINRLTLLYIPTSTVVVRSGKDLAKVRANAYLELWGQLNLENVVSVILDHRFVIDFAFVSNFCFRPHEDGIGLASLDRYLAKKNIVPSSLGGFAISEAKGYTYWFADNITCDVVVKYLINSGYELHL